MTRVVSVSMYIQWLQCEPVAGLQEKAEVCEVPKQTCGSAAAHQRFMAGLSACIMTVWGPAHFALLLFVFYVFEKLSPDIAYNEQKYIYQLCEPETEELPTANTKLYLIRKCITCQIKANL